jgi:hypothetical protein
MELMTGKPPAPQGKGRTKYPFRRMEVDQYFFLPGREATPGFQSHISETSKRLKRKFVYRTCYMSRDDGDGWALCGEDDKGATLGVGVWRTE